MCAASSRSDSNNMAEANISPWVVNSSKIEKNNSESLIVICRLPRFPQGDV